MKNIKRQLFILSWILLVLGLLFIAYLTMQSTKDSSLLSMEAGIKYSRFFPWYENKYWVMLELNNPRRLIYVYAGLAFGSVTELMMLTAPMKRGGIVRRSYLAFLVCFYIALLNQLHKLFIPGRYFDWLDLLRFALGYVPTIVFMMLCVLFIVRIVRHR